MPEFLYHAHPNRDCTKLDPALWVRIDASDENAAVKKALEREFHHRPKVLYMSKGTLRHPSGFPMVVTKNRIEWGDKVAMSDMNGKSNPLRLVNACPDCGAETEKEAEKKCHGRDGCPMTCRDTWPEALDHLNEEALQVQEWERQMAQGDRRITVSREMAMDAGDPSLEGSTWSW